jgi:hypothetical protein
MSAIPLQVKRIFEQRWAAKFASLAVSAVRKNAELDCPEQPAALGKIVAGVDLNNELASSA